METLFLQEIGQKEGEAAEGRGGIPGTQGKSLFLPCRRMPLWRIFPQKKTVREGKAPGAGLSVKESDLLCVGAERNPCPPWL